MAELAITAALTIAQRIIQRFDTLSKVDTTAKKLLGLVGHVEWALSEAQARGLLQSTGGNAMLASVGRVNGALGRLEEWIDRYDKQGEKGKIARLMDYFHAGTNLEELEQLSTDLDQECQALGLQLNLETFACVKQLLEQQKLVITLIYDLVRQPRLDESSLAEKIGKIAKIGVADVMRELKGVTEKINLLPDPGNFEKVMTVHKKCLERLKDKEDSPRKLVDHGNLKFQHCLDIAPFHSKEWLARGGRKPLGNTSRVCKIPHNP
jgi:hypothetical protein